MPHQRTRDWRRASARLHPRRDQKPEFPSCWNHKNWKLLYTRGVKLHRARQLGLLWPYREWEAVMNDAEPRRVLFVCSRNQWRSPTGEAVFRKDDGIEVRSAGTSRNARRKISIADIRWADVILVMEEKHASRIKAEYRDEVRYKALHVLDIPDDYQFMDAELVEIIRAKAEPLIWQ